jgi:hypothetical protein
VDAKLNRSRAPGKVVAQHKREKKKKYLVAQARLALHPLCCLNRWPPWQGSQDASQTSLSSPVREMGKTLL